jgi:hypothetical protein
MRPCSGPARPGASASDNLNPASSQPELAGPGPGLSPSPGRGRRRATGQRRATRTVRWSPDLKAFESSAVFPGPPTPQSREKGSTNVLSRYYLAMESTAPPAAGSQQRSRTPAGIGRIPAAAPRRIMIPRACRFVISSSFGSELASEGCRFVICFDRDTDTALGSGRGRPGPGGRAAAVPAA